MGDKVRQITRAAEGPPNNQYNFSVEDQMWQGGTNYGAIHSPARPIKATGSATSGPGGPPAAAITGPGGPIIGGPVVA